MFNGVSNREASALAKAVTGRLTGIRKLPASRKTSTTCGCTRPTGSASLPAESARWRPAAARSNSAALIRECPALCRQTNSAVAISGALARA